MNNGEKSLAIYDLLREAHKSIRKIWRQFPELVEADVVTYRSWENAVDAVDSTLYLAEQYFVHENAEYHDTGGMKRKVTPTPKRNVAVAANESTPQ